MGLCFATYRKQNYYFSDYCCIMTKVPMNDRSMLLLRADWTPCTVPCITTGRAGPLWGWESVNCASARRNSADPLVACRSASYV